MNSIRDITSAIEYSLCREDSLSYAVSCMAKRRLSCMVVCEQDKPVGIVTERDIVRIYAGVLSGQHSSDLKVGEVMTPALVYADADMPIAEALILARSRNVRHLPVVDKHHKLVGIVTQNDAIRAYLKSLDDNVKLEESYQAIKLLSLEDPMLGIGNRRAMEVDIAHTQQESEHKQSPFTIAIIDVDHFKAYNDHYGHQQGDDALTNIVASMKKNIRDSDRLYRYGGEEFVLLIPDSDAKRAYHLVERLRQEIDAANFPHEKSRYKRLTVSAGVASGELEWHSLLEYADKALYEAKRNGRNQTVIADTP